MRIFKFFLFWHVHSAVFNYFSLPWALAAAPRLPLVEESGNYSPVAVHRLLTAVPGPQWLRHRLSGPRTRRLQELCPQAPEHRLGRCGARVSLLCGSGVCPDQGSNQCPLQRGQMHIHSITRKVLFVSF